MSLSKNTVITLLAFAGVYLIWGSTYLAIAYGLMGFSPFVLSCFRFFFAGLMLVLWRLSRAEPAGSLHDWLKNGIVGTLTLTGATGLVTWGEQYISSAEAAIAVATGPFWFLIIDRQSRKNARKNKKMLVGALIGFSGLFLFLRESMEKADVVISSTTRIYALLILLSGSILWVLGSLYSKHSPAGNSTIMNTGQQLMMAAVSAGVVGLLRGEWAAFHIRGIPSEAWLGLGYLAFFGSVIAYLSYIWLISTHSPVIVSTHNYVNPVVAVILGGLFLQETITPSQLTGMIIILAGVLLINASKYRREK